MINARKLNPVALEDLKNYDKEIRELREIIIEKSTNKAATRILLDAAFFDCAQVQSFIKELGGNGFVSLDNNLDFIYDAEKAVKK